MEKEDEEENEEEHSDEKDEESDPFLLESVAEMQVGIAHTMSHLD